MNIHLILTKNIIAKQLPFAARVNDKGRLLNIVAIVKGKNHDAPKISK